MQPPFQGEGGAFNHVPGQEDIASVPTELIATGALPSAVEGSESRMKFPALNSLMEPLS